MSAVLEIRTYKLVAGTGAEFHRIFVEEPLPKLQRWGVDVVAHESGISVVLTAGSVLRRQP